MSVSLFEQLTRDYFKYTIPFLRVQYNLRPDWLMGEKGKPLELDIYFPEIKIAVEVQGEQHQMLKSVKERDKLKRKLARKEGVFVFQIDRLWHLLAKGFIEKFYKQSGVLIDTRLLPQFWRTDAKNYKPSTIYTEKFQKIKRAEKYYSHLKEVADKQAEETRSCRARYAYKQSLLNK